MSRTSTAALALMASTLGASGCGGGSSEASSHSAERSTSAASQTSARTDQASTPARALSKKVSVVNELVAGGPGGIVAKMHLSSDHPRTHRPVSVDITLSRAGRPLSGDVRYEYVQGVRIVGRGTHHHFNGSLHDVLRWPSLPAGRFLSLRAAIVTGKGTMNLNFPLKAS
jgi:hypothetical protein